jgi:hypothetical protein
VHHSNYKRLLTTADKLPQFSAHWGFAQCKWPLVFPATILSEEPDGFGAELVMQWLEDNIGWILLIANVLMLIAGGMEVRRRREQRSIASEHHDSPDKGGPKNTR